MLIAAFENTSAQKLAETMGDICPIITLRNSKPESVDQLISAMDEHHPTHVFCLGQKPAIRDKVYVELTGRLDGTEYHTNLNTALLADAMKLHRLDVLLSHNAGTSYCNHIYACGLKHILESCRLEKLVFIHVPFEKNITDFPGFSEKLKGAIKYAVLQKEIQG